MLILYQFSLKRYFQLNINCFHISYFNIYLNFGIISNHFQIYNNYLNQIPKVRNTKMNSETLHVTPSIYEDQPSQNQSNSVKQSLKHSPQTVENNDIQKQGANQQTQNNQFCMDYLCKTFMQKYKQSSEVFDPASIAKQLNAKLRRVYDFMNIMQGCGMIKEAAKGKYRWNIQEANQTNQKSSIKGDWCSLRQISFRIDRIVQNLKGGICSYELYEVITKNLTKTSVPGTIRRRIYEVCKVLTLIKRFNKHGKYYYSAKLSQQQIKQFIISKNQDQQNQDELLMNLNGVSKKCEYFIKMDRELYQSKAKKLIKKNEEDQNSLHPNNIIDHTDQHKNQIISKTFIRHLASKFKTKSNLQEFISSLTTQYNLKNSRKKILSNSTEHVECKIQQESNLHQNHQILQQKNKSQGSSHSQKVQSYSMFKTEKNRNNILRKNIIISNMKADTKNLDANPKNIIYNDPFNLSSQNWFLKQGEKNYQLLSSNAESNIQKKSENMTPQKN